MIGLPDQFRWQSDDAILRICLAVLLVTVLLVFTPVLGFEFLTLDDNVNVYNNRYLKNLTWPNVLHFWQGPYENLYIPLTYSCWAALTWISTFISGVEGYYFDPRIFHGANLVCHVGASLAVFLILREILHRNNPASLAGAMVFALHPLQVEAVAWVTAFRDVFSVTWSLLAILQYIRYIKRGGWQKGNRGVYLLASMFFVFAMLAKPGAVVLPISAGLVGLLGFQRRRGQVFLDMLPWLVVAMPIALVTAISQPGTAKDFLPTWGERILVAGDALSFYFGKLILPVELGADYGRTPQYLLGYGWAWLTGLMPFAAVGILWKKSAPFWRQAIGLFVVPLLPVLGFVHFDFQIVSTVTDRYVYPAMLGPALAGALVVYRYRTWPLMMGWLVLLVMLGCLSVMQLRHWENSRANYNNTIAVNPDSWYASNNLGNVFMADGDYRQAEIMFRKAISLRPDFPEAHNNLGLALAAAGRNREAFAAYKKAIELAPAFPESYGNLADLYRELGMLTEAIDFYNKALRRDPSRAVFYDVLGVTYLEAGRDEEARQAFERAVQVDPTYASAYNHLARWYLRAGKAEKAVYFYELGIGNGLDDHDLAEELGKLP